MNKQYSPRILTQSYDYSVQDIVDKLEAGDIDLNPDGLRPSGWNSNNDKQNKCARLIESLLLNIPIPAIYFAEHAETLKYAVIDGQQRLYTFQRFLKDGFKLKNLKLRDDVNGKKYSDLNQRDRDDISQRVIKVIVILNESDEEIKHEVFERLNLGSLKLTSQEMRSDRLRGPFNTLLQALACDSLFKELVNLRIKNDDKNMAHEELVLRFFAYHDRGYKSVKNFSYFLTDYMKKNQNISDDRVYELKKLFLNTIALVDHYIGKKAFLNFNAKTGKWETLLNRALYDAEMLAFSSFVDKNIYICPDEFVMKLEALMKDDAFKKSLQAQSDGDVIENSVFAIKKIISSEYS